MRRDVFYEFLELYFLIVVRELLVAIPSPSVLV